MSNLARWILVGSVFLALIIMVVAWVITRWKVKSIQQKYANQNTNKKINLRENSGELLWDLKQQAKDPLEDLQMEMLLSTIQRNNFQKVNLTFENEYIKTTLSKLGKQKFVQENYDWLLLDTNEKLNQEFDKFYKQSQKGTMIVIVNAKKSNKEIKKLKNYLKLTSIRNDYDKVGLGMLFVVKE